MAKIKKIEITNFRNIKHLVIEVRPSGYTIIAGDNNLGKSNTLNAVNWFLTGTLFTDKWGTGENDIDSIIPINQIKGEFVSVSVEFETGIVFEKQYRTQWDIKTGKPKGHTSAGLINGAESRNMKLWTDELYKELNYTPYLNGFKELNIFTDALYALQKLDPKDLRVLLQKLGCNVTNDEVFKALNLGVDATFMELEQVKYRGNFYDMRADYKRKVLADRGTLEQVKNQLALFNDVDNADTTTLDKIKHELDEVNKNFYSLSSTLDSKLNELYTEVSQLKIKHDEDLAQFRVDKFNRKAKIISAINKEEERIEKIKNNANKDGLEAIGSVEKEIELQCKTIEAYNNSLTSIQQAMERSSAAGKGYVAEQRETAIKLNTLLKEVYQDFITCPNCQHQFILDEGKKDMWEFNRKRDIELLNKKLDELKANVAKELENLKSYKIQFAQAQENYNKAVKDLEVLNNKKQDLQNNVSSTKVEVDTTALDRLNAQLSVIDCEQYDTRALDNRIDSLNEEIIRCKTERDAELEKLRFDLQQQKNELLEQQHQEELKIYDFQKKQELLKKQDEILEIYNQHEYQLEIINKFIHKSIEMANEKAREVTGFNFVMLEETLSETIKEVCYLTVDGVPFASVNTSKKILIGTQFIKRIKEILKGYGVPVNDLPILVDKLETVSNNTLDSNKDLFAGIQFITTKVTEGKEITIC